VKLLLAPSKTMAAHPVNALNPPPFKAQKDALLTIIQSYSVNDLINLYAVSKPLALENKQRFEHFEEGHLAYHAYTGYMFKMMDKKTLDEASAEYIKKHLMIVSGLYGLVGMDHTIGLYRLPMGVTLNEPLSKYWQAPLTAYLKDEWIIDLLSQEYRDALDTDNLNTTQIDFVEIKNHKEHRAAMTLKKCRGLMVRACARHQVHDKKTLQTLNIDGFTYDKNASTEKIYVYKKHS
jgi:cytoplasmic iron level regulating protein YaaA (DUF328/UPF0246 family)